MVQWAINIVLGVVTRFFDGDGGLWLYLILIFCVDWFYHFGCECFFRGQSLGKRIMGIRVVRNDGAPVDPGSSFLRNLLRFADTFLFLYPIAFVSMAAGGGFRRLGDWAAGTLVVYTPKSLALPLYAGPYRGPEAAVSGQGRIVHRPLDYEERQAILMFARRYPLLGEARAGEIARPYAAFLRTAGGAAPADGAGEAAPADGAGELSGAAWLLRIARKLSGPPEDGPPAFRQGRIAGNGPLPAADGSLPAGSGREGGPANGPEGGR
jgi:uncharacterized RDD family membrane protein YckC